MSTGRRKAVRRRWRPRVPRAEWLVALTLLFVAVLLGWLVVQVISQNRDLRTSNAARDALARQVQGLGEKPVAGPPGSRGEPGAGEKGQDGAVGSSGPSGPPGATGPSGEAGAKGERGQDGTIGASGPPGPEGSPGPQGEPGADSVVPGPSGPPGRDATGAPGQDGTDGKDGSDGTDGSDGQDGAPPSDWTFTDSAGVTYRCTRVDDFDPADPRYQCTPTSSPAPDPSPSEPVPPPAPSDEPSGEEGDVLFPLGIFDRRPD